MFIKIYFQCCHLSARYSSSFLKLIFYFVEAETTEPTPQAAAPAPTPAPVPVPAPSPATDSLLGDLLGDIPSAPTASVAQPVAPSGKIPTQNHLVKIGTWYQTDICIKYSFFC